MIRCSSHERRTVNQIVRPFRHKDSRTIFFHLHVFFPPRSNMPKAIFFRASQSSSGLTAKIIDRIFRTIAHEAARRRRRRLRRAPTRRRALLQIINSRHHVVNSSHRIKANVKSFVMHLIAWQAPPPLKKILFLRCSSTQKWRFLKQIIFWGVSIMEIG